MDRSYFDDFKQRIAPYEGLWQSVRVCGLASLTGGFWISLSLRILLSDRPAERFSISILGKEFLYFVAGHPVAAFEKIAAEALVDGYVDIQATESRLDAPARIFLTRKQTGSATATATLPSWFVPQFQERGACRRFHGITRASVVITGQGDRLLELLPYEKRLGIDSKLRFGSPSYDGIKDLAVKLEAASFDPDSGTSAFEIIAPLPFDLECPAEEKVIVHAPSSTPDGVLAVRFFFEPKHGPVSEPFILRNENAEARAPSGLLWRLPVAWPTGSTRAKARLFFHDTQIDCRELTRWKGGASLRAALDDHFDPGHQQLRSTVLENSKVDAREFERGVARLLTLFEIPLVWYGNAPVERLPDLAGCFEVSGAKIIVLAECTLEKPEAKFSALALRTQELQAKFKGEAEIVPVVFTRAPTAPTEKQHAAEHRIALAGRTELERLFELLQQPGEAGTAIEFLRQLARFTPSGLDELSRWDSRWT
jgi:hypothetical protein